MSTCNIAQTKGVLVVLGTSALDMFLRNNARPKFLIIQFDGPDFYRAQSWADTTSYMEGGIPLIRYYPTRQLLITLAAHPDLFLGMMRYAFVTGPVNWWRNRGKSMISPISAETPVDVHFVRAEPSYRSCDQVEDIDPTFHKPDVSFIHWLREHYRSMADHVIINVAPSSVCDLRANYLKETLTDIDNEFQQYPVSFFNEGYSHYSLEGVKALSNSLAEQIKHFNY